MVLLRYWVLGLLLAMPVAGYAQAKIPVTIGLSKMPPLTIPGAIWQGIYPELLTEAFKTTDYQLTFKALPYRRALQDVISGELDLITFAAGEGNVLPHAFNEAVNHGRPIYKLNVAFFYDIERHSKLQWSRASLNGKVFAVYKQYDAYDMHQRYQDIGLRIESTSSWLGMFKMLGLGRVDLVSAVDVVGLNVLAQLYPDRKQNFALFYEQPQTQTLVKLGVSKKVTGGAENLRQQFDRSITQLLRNGKYREIKQRYYPVGRKVMLSSIPYAEYGVVPAQ